LTLAFEQDRAVSPPFSLGIPIEEGYRSVPTENQSGVAPAQLWFRPGNVGRAGLVHRATSPMTERRIETDLNTDYI